MKWTPREVLRVREWLGEDQATFAKRFTRSRRTILRWEQEGARVPKNVHAKLDEIAEEAKAKGDDDWIGIRQLEKWDKKPLRGGGNLLKELRLVRRYGQRRAGQG
jgi:DNA-binding XRE family transcriptional regulator